MDRAAYLRRIGYDGDVAATAHVLHGLHVAHMHSVPFENLDIHIGTPIRLDVEAFFDKIVNRRRGGFCYELNGLFAWLLQDIGFDVTLLAAGVYNAEQNQFGPLADHLCLRVELDESWLADVGFGASFLRPMRMDPSAEHEERHSRFRLELDGDDWTMMETNEAGEWTPQYRFNLRPQRMYDFTYGCHWMQTAPESIFRQRRICTLATAEGRITLSNMRLIETVNGAKTEREIAGEDEYRELLRTRFGLML